MKERVGANMAVCRLQAVWILAVLAASRFAVPAQADDWPNWLGPKKDGVWHETGLLEKFPQGGPKVIWRKPINPGYCGPAVAAGKLFVMDRITEKDKDGKPVSPKKGVVAGKERVVCLEASDGSTVWIQEFDCPYTISYGQGPRATPWVDGDRVFTLGAMGNLRCNESATGKVVWEKDLPKEYKTKPPLWGYSASPLVDGDLIYTQAGGDGSALVALDKRTGKEVWRALKAEEVGYSPPMLCEAGGKRQLIVWLDTSVNSLDPLTGKTYWSLEHPEAKSIQRPVVNIVTPVKSGDNLLVSEFYQGSALLKLDGEKPDAKLLWRSKSKDPSKPDNLNALMATPIIRDGHIYGVCGMGEMRCVKLDTGELVWESLKATGGKKALFAHTFIIPAGDKYVLFNDQGDLILAKLSPKGYEEIARHHLLDTTFTTRGRDVVWCHPAFANKCLFVHNDKEILCVSMARD